MSRKTSDEVLRSVGIAIFGERWQRPLAICLEVDERQIRRWLEPGQLKPDNKVFERLLEVVEANEAALIKERQALVRWLAGV